MPEVRIVKLITIDAIQILQQLRSEDKTYVMYFSPYDWGTDSFLDAVEHCRLDMYFGIFVDCLPVGFYMLRGFDKGFKIPSYGIYVSSRYSGKGLARRTLRHAYEICRKSEVKSLMLKVHPANLVAKSLYEAEGFILTSIDQANNNLVYIKEFF